MELHNFTCFTLRTDGLYLPKLFLHELAVAHSKASISWLSVIVFADTLVMKAPQQNETGAKIGETVGLLHKFTFFTFADRWLLFANLIY